MPDHIDDMPGPTIATKRLQLAQRDALADYYAIADNPEQFLTTDEYEEALAAVGRRVDGLMGELQLLIGQDAHCEQVDVALWSLFVRQYEIANQITPIFHITRAGVESWLKRLNDED